MPPLKLDRILRAEAGLQPVLAKAHDLKTLAGLLAAFLPPELAAQCRVVNYRDGEMVLVAAHPAAASKLRLLAPSLQKLFSKQRWQVNSVSLRVQPSASHQTGAAPPKSAHLSTHTLERMSSLYQGMADSPARAALGALLRRRGVNPPAGPRRQTAAAAPAGQKRRT